MRVWNSIDRLFQPNPKVITSRMDQEVTYRRNKAIFFIQMYSSLSVVFFGWITTGKLNPTQKMSLFQFMINITVFFLCCRSHIKLLNAIYFITNTLFGPALFFKTPDSIFFNTIQVSTVPLWIICITGSKRLFILQTIIQNVFLHTLYKPRLMQVIETIDRSAYINRAASMTTLGAFTNSLFVLTMASALQKAYWDINVTEAKKNELERQKTFLLGFSHELRNLINSITITIQLCLLEEIPLKVKDLLQSSQVCGELLSHLVNNILDTGKAEIGELEVNPSANNVFDLLEKIWGVCSQLIMNQKLYGRMQIDKNVPRYLQVDNHRLTQIMLNLVGNAIKFTEKGSVSVEISWVEGKDKADDKVFYPIPFDEEDEGIFEKTQKLSRLTEDSITMDAHCRTKIKYVGGRESHVHSPKGILKITVTDTGIGIGPDQIPQLFNKFTQVCRNPNKKTLGTGLGLFITKQLINKMGGEVRVFSKVDRGSAFIACIPANVVEEPQDTTSLENTAPAFNPGLTELKVMVVDDSEFNRKILTKCLNKLGVQVQEVAHNGREAVDKYKEHIRNGKSFDVITMDVDMPVMDGKQATELIREYERLHNLRAALIATISGNVTESEIGECLNKNGLKQADFFFKKPTSIEDLAFIIKKRRATQIPV